MLGVGPLDAVQRGHRNEGVATLDEGTHVAEEEGQQQRGNVLAVDVGVRHDDDLAVAELGDIEVFADAGPEGSDEGADRVRGQSSVQARLFDVEDLAADRQDGLALGVAAADGGAACGVALDDEDFTFGGRARGAVAQLAGHGGGFEDALAARGLTRLASGDAGGLGGLTLGDDGLSVGGVGVEPVGELGIYLLGDESAGFGVAELGLCLAFELRFGELDRDDGSQAFADVVTGEVVVLVADDALVAAVAVDEGGQRGAEAFLVHAAFGRVDGVGKGVDGGGVGGGPLHGDFHAHGAFVVVGFEVDDLVVDRVGLLGGVEVLDVVAQAVLVAVGDGAVALGLLVRDLLTACDLVAFVSGELTLVGQGDAQALVEEGHLLEALAQGLEVEFDGFEDLGVRVEDLRGAGFVGCFAAFEGGDGGAAVCERHAPHVALAADFGVHAGGQGVDDGDADAVQATRDGVSAAAELAASVEDRHDDLDGGLVLGGVLVDGDASAVVDDFDAAVCLDGNLNVVRVAGQGLVDGVVDDLVDEVVQAAFAGRADVHARTLADGFQAFEDGDVRCAVGLLAFGGLLVVSHVAPLALREK